MIDHPHLSKHVSPTGYPVQLVDAPGTVIERWHVVNVPNDYPCMLSSGFNMESPITVKSAHAYGEPLPDVIAEHLEDT